MNPASCRLFRVLSDPHHHSPSSLTPHTHPSLQDDDKRLVTTTLGWRRSDGAERETKREGELEVEEMRRRERRRWLDVRSTSPIMLMIRVLTVVDGGHRRYRSDESAPTMVTLMEMIVSSHVSQEFENYELILGHFLFRFNSSSGYTGSKRVNSAQVRVKLGSLQVRVNNSGQRSKIVNGGQKQDSASFTFVSVRSTKVSIRSVQLRVLRNESTQSNRVNSVDSVNSVKRLDEST
ncbi:hypothetical protein Hanom_Chr16g01415011 [Helianthus anomalus]